MLSSIILVFSGLLVAVSNALPRNSQAEYPTLIQRRDVQEQYDYIIVGAGSAGLTVGDRLSEDGKRTVLVIEYGELSDAIDGFNMSRMRGWKSLSSPGYDDRAFDIFTGATVGGSGSINGQNLVRGTVEEYDAFKTLGGNLPSSVWDWNGLLSGFRKAFTLGLPDKEQAAEYDISYDEKYWGTTSQLFGSFGKGRLNPIVRVLYDLMKSVPKVKVATDSGAGTPGLVWFPQNQDPVKFSRSFSKSAHWDGVKRANYHLLTGHEVKKVLFKGNTAVGVEYVSTQGKSDKLSVSAKREVILAASAYQSPQILMLSGIGPRSVLDEAGITVKVELPGVGSNFQDHPTFPFDGFSWTTQPPASDEATPDTPEGRSNPPQLEVVLPLPVLSDKAESIAKSHEAQSAGEFLPSSYTPEQIEGYARQKAIETKMLRSLGTGQAMIIMGGGSNPVQVNFQLHPSSRGQISLNPKDPEGLPIVDYRTGSNPTDIAVLVEVTKFVRKYLASSKLAKYGPTQKGLGPVGDEVSDEEIEAWVRSNLSARGYHPVGTCSKMPRKWGGVVDEGLLVYGVKKLSVVDASVHPISIGGNVGGTVFAVAEKAAELIQARNK
ncbi:hypothetical protein CEP53_001040 [Fusarium sp. AF-6]|nr:hypothetical protein CEP53_001040 [Fusarium sp. AF-6]